MIAKANEELTRIEMRFRQTLNFHLYLFAVDSKMINISLKDMDGMVFMIKLI